MVYNPNKMSLLKEENCIKILQLLLVILIAGGQNRRVEPDHPPEEKLQMF